jgi:hypothetical protein
MAKEWAIKFYKSKQWHDCREAYIAYVFGLCEMCNSAGYIVHHKVRLTPMNINDPDVSINHEHLQYLCIDCHNSEHYRKIQGVTKEGLMFDEHGDLVEELNNGDS